VTTPKVVVNEEKKIKGWEGGEAKKSKKKQCSIVALFECQGLDRASLLTKQSGIFASSEFGIKN